jgi:hypothetical protein
MTDDQPTYYFINTKVHPIQAYCTTRKRATLNYWSILPVILTGIYAWQKKMCLIANADVIMFVK